jgi:putative transposase
MHQFAGCARYVFNQALAMQNEERERTGRKLSGYATLCKLLTGWRHDPETAWLAEAQRQTLSALPAVASR